MDGKRLFVIKEAGSAAFCIPLWQKWLKNPPNFEWQILADSQAQMMISAQLGVDAPLSGKWGEIPALDDVELVMASATGDSFEAAFMQEQVEFIQFLDAPYDLEKRIAPSLKNILIIHDIVREEAQHLVERVDVIGHPGWEQVTKRSYNIGSPDIFVFVAQPISQIPTLADLGYDESIVWELLCRTQKCYPEQIKELIYCSHPSQSTWPVNFGSHQRMIESDESPLEVAGTMVGMFTALMIDSYLVGQRVISLQPDLAQQDRCLLSRLDLIPCITSDEPADIVEAEQSSMNNLEMWLDGSLTRFEKVCCS